LFNWSSLLGAFAYADDIVLLAPIHKAMQNLFAVCDNFAHECHVVFNAKKSKCLYFNSYATRSRISTNVSQFSVDGNDIEFVDEWPHLGHIIITVHNDKADIISKRNVLCGQINSVL